MARPSSPPKKHLISSIFSELTRCFSPHADAKNPLKIKGLSRQHSSLLGNALWPERRLRAGRCRDHPGGDPSGAAVVGGGPLRHVRAPGAARRLDAGHLRGADRAIWQAAAVLGRAVRRRRPDDDPGHRRARSAAKAATAGGNHHLVTLANHLRLFQMNQCEDLVSDHGAGEFLPDGLVQ